MSKDTGKTPFDYPAPPKVSSGYQMAMGSRLTSLHESMVLTVWQNCDGPPKKYKLNCGCQISCTLRHSAIIVNLSAMSDHLCIWSGFNPDVS